MAVQKKKPTKKELEAIAQETHGAMEAAKPVEFKIDAEGMEQLNKLLMGIQQGKDNGILDHELALGALIGKLHQVVHQA